MNLRINYKKAFALIAIVTACFNSFAQQFSDQNPTEILYPSTYSANTLIYAYSGYYKIGTGSGFPTTEQNHHIVNFKTGLQLTTPINNDGQFFLRKTNLSGNLSAWYKLATTSDNTFSGTQTFNGTANFDGNSIFNNDASFNQKAIFNNGLNLNDWNIKSTSSELSFNSTIYNAEVLVETGFRVNTINGYIKIGGNSSIINTDNFFYEGNNFSIKSKNSNATYDLLVNSYGNVTIGTGTVYNGDYKLSVNGKVACTELKVDTDWADFVFEDNYKLRELEEVEDFINENKHLPDVPSAKQVQEEGLKVAEMQTVMMQKIEELTLYMIELKKENKAMKAEIEALK